MATITLLKFNNYYNRTIKKLETLQEYKAISSFFEYTGVNFNPNDGVDTNLIVNYGSLSGVQYIEADSNYDYLLVSENNMIISRWFVMEATRVCKGQARYNLHRDVIADNYDAILNSPCYIEKATIPESNDLIFNSEGMQFNQIKKKEIKLKDNKGLFYYVAYVSNPIPQENRVITIPATDFEFQTISNPSRFLYGTSKDSTSCVQFYFTNDYNVRIAFTQAGSSHIKHYDIKYNNGELSFSVAPNQVLPINPIVLQFKQDTFIGEEFDSVADKVVANMVSHMSATTLLGYIKEQVDAQLSSATPYATLSEFNDAQRVVGTVVYDNWIYGAESNDAYFSYDELQATEIGATGGPVKCAESTNLALFLIQEARTACSSEGYEYNTVNGPVYLKTSNVNKYRLLRTNVTEVSSVSITLPSGLHTNDAPYDILVIPAFISFASGTFFGIANTINSDYQKALVKKITEVGTSQGWLYDIQRLPYSELSKSNIKINGSGAVVYSTLGDRVTFDGSADYTNAKVMIYTQESKQVTFNIYQSISVKELKVENECDMYRLVSPNGQGIFEFSAAKNDGVDYFNIDCTLRPINPYIHINPNFKRLYQADYNDYKGLICGGDFSIATVSDRWLQYASQNKYLAQTFSREIENYDFNARYAMLEQGLGAGASAVGTGVAAGVMTGSPVVGIGVGVASAGAGVADLFIAQDKIREGKSLKTDLFNYSLRNVQAQPKTLVKTGADDFNNKIWITLEYYSCTDTEKEALRQKLKYNGMTVMAIGTIAEYIQLEPTYIQGRLIRMLGITEDTHMITQIASEIAKGVYI